MKKTKIAIGVIILGGMLATLVSWPSQSPEYPPIITPKTIQDFRDSNPESIPNIHMYQIYEEPTMLAVKNSSNTLDGDIL